jgi:hypothetical protein
MTDHALAREALSANHCHGTVVRDGIEDACGKPPTSIIDGRDTEDNCCWPACAYHANRYGGGRVVPLERLLAAVIEELELP